MRKLLVLLMVAVLMISPAFAHPGGTDGKGGHWNHSTGEYHYHHGYSAHDHEDGVCPYEFDDKTGERSGSSSGSSSVSKSSYSQAGLTSIYQTLQKGDRGNDVADLQRRLNSLGYSAGEPDGVFGTRTQTAVKQFQKDNGINATGNVSFVTLKALFPELAPVATARPTTKPIVGSVVTTKPTTKPSYVTSYRSSEETADDTLTEMYLVMVVAFVLILIIIVAYLIAPSRRKDKNHLIRHELDEIERQLNRIDDKFIRSKRYKSRAPEVGDITGKIRALLDQLDA